MDKMSIFLSSSHINEKDYREVLDSVASENRSKLRLLSLLTFIISLILFTLSFVNIGIDGLRICYVIMFGMSLVSFLLSQFLPKPVHRNVVIAVVYLYLSSLFIVAMLMGTYFQPGLPATIFTCVLFAAPILFVDTPARMIVFIILTEVSFITLCLFYKESNLLINDVINSIIFGTISCILSSITMRDKAKTYIIARDRKILSEKDLLTDMLNRNCFEQDLSKLAKKDTGTIACVYFDVNGLHTVNNTYGHSSGDEMLKYIAKTIKKQFGSENTYRIGGDEFVAFVMDIEKNEVEEGIEIINNTVKEAAYSVSIGMSYHKAENCNMSFLIRTAEERMYKAKDLYYQQKEER